MIYGANFWDTTIRRLRKKCFPAEDSPSGWKPRPIPRQLRHEWNSCPSQNPPESEVFSGLLGKLQPAQAVVSAFSWWSGFAARAGRRRRNVVPAPTMESNSTEP
jgi:hypothetical protein